MILSLQAFSQQVPLYSQYMLNGFLLNPAIAGAEGYTAVNMTAREQWIGFQDAPGTYALSFQTRMLKKSYISKSSSVKKRQRYGSRSGKIGVGGYVFNDRNGAVERTGVKFSYAYHLNFRNSQLSMGLAVSAYQLRLNDEMIILENPDDDIWNNAHGTTFIPDADVGAYYNARSWYVGLSVDQLFESVVKLGNTGYDQYKMERNYYFIGGYDFEVNDKIILTPSTMFKFAENGSFQADFSGKVYFNQSYWGGITYRTGHAIILLAGLSIDRLVFGYAFDISLSSIMKHSFGTHEFVFAAKFGDNARRYRWLNRY